MEKKNQDVNYGEALRRIKKAKEENVNSLSLSSLGLEKIPEEICELTQLNELYLNTNQISDISPLSCLTKLIELDLGENKITHISALKSLRQLTSLYLNTNQISDITSLKVLTQLIQLGLSNNQITVISSLKALKKLNKLSLCDNQIRQFELNLSAYPELNFLSLKGNPIRNIPNKIFDTEDGTDFDYNCFRGVRNHQNKT